MKRSKIFLFLVSFSLALIGCSLLTENSDLSGKASSAAKCKSLSYIGGSMNASHVSNGEKYTISCNFGKVVDCISPEIPSGTCKFIGFNGTKANFDCTAGNTGGTVRCSTFADSSSKCCQQSNSLGVLNVNQASKNSNGLITIADKDAQGQVQIFSVTSNGSSWKQLTSDNNHSWMPAWSPDGKKIAYVSRQSGGMQIWVMDSNGDNKKQLTETLAGVGALAPSWSPDGQKIAYSSNTGSQALKIWVMNSNGSNRRQITLGPFDDNIPTWSPDGTKIAFTSNRDGGRYQIWVMNAKGKNPKLLTRAYYDEKLQADIEQKVPAWSPDGKYIAYWAGVEATDPRRGLPRDVWIMNADGSNQRKLGTGDDPKWSPDGSTIIHSGCADEKGDPVERSCGLEPGDAISVVAVGPNGSDKRLLFRAKGTIDGLSWQPVKNTVEISISLPTPVKLGKIPDNADIVYHSNGLIYTMNRSGGNLAQITFENPRNIEHVAVSYDHRYVVIDDHPRPLLGNDAGLARMFLFDLEKGTEAQLVPEFAAAGDGGVGFDQHGFIYFAGSRDLSPDDAYAIELYKIKYDGTGLTQLTDTPNSREGDPGVSEDGSLVAFLRVPAGKNYDQLWVMNSDGTNPRMVIDNAGPLGVASVHDPEVSSDNQRVVFSRWNSDQPSTIPGTGPYKNNLWIINIDTTGLRRLTKPAFLTIAPNLNGSDALFTEITDQGAFASVVSLDGAKQIPTRIKAQANAPKWIPKDVAPPTSNAIQYLTFQIFTSDHDPAVPIGESPMKAPPSKTAMAGMIQNVIDTIGTKGNNERKLGFIMGPLALDQTDEQMRQIIRDSFAIALEKNVSIGFHIDDSKFWVRRSDLWSNSQNVEWRNWNGKPSTGLKLAWGPQPVKIGPQMCFNSKAVKQEVKRLARDVIGQEIADGVNRLTKKGKQDLLAGVITGWETGMGRDFDAEDKVLGYCGFTNRGFNKTNPPPDLDKEREKIVHEFIELWAKNLIAGGVQKEKVYGHVAFFPKVAYNDKKSKGELKYNETYSQMVWSAPPEVVISEYLHPGYSLYSTGGIDELYELFGISGNPSWAMAEGTNMDYQRSSMESYLARMFGHGATLVNIFAWGIGGNATKNDPFRIATEGPDSIKAYKKFLNGKNLSE